MREYEIDVILEAFPYQFPDAFGFLDIRLCGIEQVAEEVCEKVLDRFALWQLCGHVFLRSRRQLLTDIGDLQFPPEIALIPEP